MRSDSDIIRDVEDELRWDPELDATEIAVTVKNGIVILAGFVRSLPEKERAEVDVKRVVGVLAVANDLEIRLPGVDERPDPDLLVMPSFRSKESCRIHGTRSGWW